MALLESLFITFLLLLGIVWSCSIFTNAIEWMGERFQLSKGAVGSVLAAVGTALPETLVPAVALFEGHLAQMGHLHDMTHHFSKEAEHIGVGAILGAPFLLSTLGMFLVGLAVFYFASLQKRGVVLHLDLHLFKRDLSYFFPAYGMVFLASFIPSHPVKWAIAIGLLAFYGIYVYRTLRIEHVPDAEFSLEPLTLAPKSSEPPTTMIVFQTLLGLFGILLMAHLFVQEIHSVATILGVSALLLSLIIAPIATELPEKFNSVVWISKKKDNLALGNITGAMVFQSCIPTAIGLSFTPWVLDVHGTLSVLLCFLSAGIIYASVVYGRRLSPRVLLIGGLFYTAFLFYSIVSIIRG